MKFKIYSFLVLLVSIGVGGALWYFVRFGEDGAFYDAFLPEIVFGAFLIFGFFIFFLLRYFLRTRLLILDRDRKLVEKNKRFELITEGLNDGIWDWNFKTGEVYFSEDWKRMLHFSLGETSNEARSGGGEMVENTQDWWAGRIHPDDIASVKQHMKLYFSGKRGYYEAEYRIRDGRGEYVWILDRGSAEEDADGNLVRMAGMTSNIQDMKNVEKVLKSRTGELEKAKEEIEGEKARTEAVLESIGEGVIAVDKAGFITVANEAGAKMLGLSSKDMIGMAFGSAVPKEENRKERPIRKEDRLVYQTLATGEKYSAVFFYYRHDKDKFPVSVTSAPVLMGGVLSGAIVVFRDITTEMEIDKQKTEFVSLASHQLRTPLSAIRWYSEMVLSEKLGNLSDKQKKYMNEIYESNIRMIELVNSLLNVSRIELGTFAVEPTKVDLWEMFESVVDELMPVINKKDQELVKNYENAPRSFYVDKNLMRIVFQNLLSNAVKYTQPGGKITVSVYEKGEFLRVEVADNGYGIPEEDQSKMFQKLFRADNVKTKDTEGTGLGLYIIKSVVEKTGGRIWFESVENEGTTFFVELPLTGMKKIEGMKGLEK